MHSVSLVYPEGLFYTAAHTRLRAVAVGGSGPDLIIGRATTRRFHQSVLSKRLSPPVKWSYRKLILWWALVSFSIGWILFYINTLTKNSASILSPPLIRFSLLSAATFLSIGWIVFYINTVYQRFLWCFVGPVGSPPSRSYCRWFSSGGTISSPTSVGTPSRNARSCQRCGTLTEQEF